MQFEEEIHWNIFYLDVHCCCFKTFGGFGECNILVSVTTYRDVYCSSTWLVHCHRRCFSSLSSNWKCVFLQFFVFGVLPWLLGLCSLTGKSIRALSFNTSCIFVRYYSTNKAQKKGPSEKFCQCALMGFFPLDLTWHLQWQDGELRNILRIQWDYILLSHTD